MKNQKGQSLFEVVVALAISTMVIIALVALAASSIRNANFSKNKTIASRYAQEATEWLRAQRDADPTAFALKTGTFCMQTLSFDVAGSCNADMMISDLFNREVTLTSSIVSVGGVDKNIITADVAVTWKDVQGDHEVKSTTEFSDWRQR